MVRRFSLRRLWRDQSGISMLEGLIALPIVLLVFAALVEFGFAVYQWNQTVKALQLGARMAAVSDPIVSTSGAGWTALTTYGTALPGDPVPDTEAVASCGAGMAETCVADEINRLVYGVDASGSIDDECDPDYGRLPGMCDFNRAIEPSVIWVSYQRSGLGYVGRPGGPVVTVTVGTRGLGFDLPLLGRMLNLGRFEIPAHPVTVTSEDLSSVAP